MIINSPDITKVVHEYDLVFDSGSILPLVIDYGMGDTFEIQDNVIRAVLTAKPSLSDPTKLLPAEDITVFKSKLSSVIHRERTMILQTLEQKEEWKKLLEEFSGEGKTRH